MNLPSVKITKISAFTTPRSRKENRPINCFIIQLKAGEDEKNLIKIRYILHQRITWEKLRKYGVNRCFECQAFGHCADYCAKNVRCMFCAGTHLTKDCVQSDLDAEKRKLKCSNCEQEGHSSNDSKCPSYQKFKEKRSDLKMLGRAMSEKRNRSARETVYVINSNYSSKSANAYKSFAEVARSANLNENTNSNNIFTEFINESKVLFGITFSELCNKIRAFWRKYKLIQETGKKLEEFLIFVASLVANVDPK